MSDVIDTPSVNDPLEPVETTSQEKDNKTIWIIVAVVLILLCCCCVALTGAAVWLWYNGDALLGISAAFPVYLLFG